ncbi:hypothetical protein G5C51_04700 [Streptomyces sp. A7024]|uniref:Uncharacterized protein n=1 Tax=Streptomyces coryli TaxID=1128680 RepID=A0A6G4TVR5_9ACTN|nr:hypothetical protein [Streptomyces coryli]NGN63208.1 hypothetical protein [Streptomyces coryli]
MLTTQWYVARAMVLDRYYRAKNSDDGVTTTEVALITGALLTAGGLLIAAVKTKLAEKIGIINGG